MACLLGGLELVELDGEFGLQIDRHRGDVIQLGRQPIQLSRTHVSLTAPCFLFLLFAYYVAAVAVVPAAVTSPGRGTGGPSRMAAAALRHRISAHAQMRTKKHTANTTRDTARGVASKFRKNAHNYVHTAKRIYTRNRHQVTHASLGRRKTKQKHNPKTTALTLQQQQRRRRHQLGQFEYAHCRRALLLSAAAVFRCGHASQNNNIYTNTNNSARRTGVGNLGLLLANCAE